MAVLGVGWRLAALVAGVVVGLAALITLADAAYELRLYGSPYGLLDLHRAWTPAGALAVLESWASPPEADLLRAARWFVVWDFVFLVGLATFLAGSVLLVRGPIARAATIPDAQLRTSRTAAALQRFANVTVMAPLIAVAFGGVGAWLDWRVLSTAAASGPRAAVGAMTRVASGLAHAKLLLLVLIVVVLIASGVVLLARHRGRGVKNFVELLRVIRFSLLSVVVVGIALCVPDQIRDAFRTLAEASWSQILFTEGVLLVWALTVWYTARFLLNVDFETDATFGPHSPDLPGERHWPRMLGAVAFGVFALGAALAWREVADLRHPMARYPWLVWLAVVNVFAGVIFWQVTTFRKELVKRLTSRSLTSPRGKTFRAMPPSVQRLVWTSLAVAGALWLGVFFLLQNVAPLLGTVALLLGASITILLAGSLLVWFGERTKLPAIALVLALSFLFSLTNDNHTVRRLPGARGVERIAITQHVRDWHASIMRKHPGREHPLFVISAAGGGIRAGYWTASVLARLQDMNAAFADHTLLVSSVSGGSLGSLVFANLLDVVEPGPTVDVASCAAKGRYQTLASRLLARDFLAPTAASMLYGDFLARLLPVSFLADRAEALEVAWERAWDTVDAEPPPSMRRPLWDKNPFARSFDALYAGERVDPARADTSRRLPLVILNGTVVESGMRIAVSHLEHPPAFRGDLEHAFDHRDAPMRMSTAALMSARFTYVSPAGTYAPGTHVVDGGYFENSGAVTAIQWWAEIVELIDELNTRHPHDTIRGVFLYIDNTPPPSDRAQAAARRAAPPARAEWPSQSLWLLPELSPPVNALLHAREAHAVEARHRARRIFGDDLISFDTNRLLGEDTGAGLDSAPLGWVLSRTTQRILDREVCKNVDSFEAVRRLLPVASR